MSYEEIDLSKRPDGRMLGLEPMGVVIDRFHDRLAAHGGGTAEAMRRWIGCTGPREKAHTIAVYVVEPPAPGRPRVLKVYVDSNAAVSDFRTNAEVYQVKLAAAGLEVDQVEFRLSRKARFSPVVKNNQTLVRDSRETFKRPALSDELSAKLKEQIAAVASDELRTSLENAVFGGRS